MTNQIHCWLCVSGSMLVRTSVVVITLGRREEGEGRGLYFYIKLPPISQLTREPVAMVTESHQILRSSVLVCWLMV